MLDLKYVIDNIEEVIKRLETRTGDFAYLRELIPLQSEKRELVIEVEALKMRRNEVSKLIGQYKRDKKDPKELFDEIENKGDIIAGLDEKIKAIDLKIAAILDITPNIPDFSVPVGDESANLELYKVGVPRKFKFKPKDHIELGEKLGIFDFERAAKISGARFVVDKGLGARLERSLIQFMMDMHAIEHGYTECIPPYIVSGASMYATGQFPKFKSDSFKLEGHDLYLNPTAEVPTINMYRDEIIDGNIMPLKFVSYTTAFRSEAGSAGRDTRGIIRQHQFNKVELIKISKPEESSDDLLMMLKNAEEVLKRLEIPYRVVALSTGDIGFGMAKTYDIEVWLPGQNTYREISSVSSAEDFQGRRANIRFKRTKDSKTEYVHTLNGSGLAVGRTMVAVLENYQNEDGTVTVPKALIPYMKTDIIK